MSAWTFVTSHGAVLALAARHDHITAREIALELGITERSVHRIICEMAAEGYVTKHRSRRVNWYTVNTDLSLRRPEARKIAVKELIKILRPSGEKEPAPPASPDSWGSPLPREP